MNTNPIKQKILEEIRQEKERDYEQRLQEMIQKYCPDENLNRK